MATLTLGGCSTSTPTASTSPNAPVPSTSASASTTDKATPAASAQPSQKPADSIMEKATALAEKLDISEQAASLVMAGVPAQGASAAEIAALKRQGISNIFLRGRSHLSVKQTAVKVKEITGSLEVNVPDDLPVFVATDQEGGFVQVLQGAGFSDLPAAKEQGAWSQEKLRTKISRLGAELAQAGVNVNLAPVADVVPASLGTANAPIGYFGRQYASNASEVSAAVQLVNQELAQAAVRPVVKHFPGLGKVRENTDTHSSVTDTTTNTQSADLQPFADAIAQDLSWVMISNARYTKLDTANDAPFSKKIITGLLREQMGYQRLIISDDLCEAEQVKAVPVGQRAVKFIRAGGSMALCVNANQAITMAKAITAQAQEDPKFAQQVREAAVLVMAEKLRSQN